MENRLLKRSAFTMSLLNIDCTLLIENSNIAMNSD